jgi:hypothetical protein
MSPDHAHKASESSQSIYQAAKAEAAKILAHRADLIAATESLTKRRIAREAERSDTTVHYEWFAGENAQAGERVGFIPSAGRP